ncbi:S-adenosyl-L-methionine-dependent methyltransferase [Ascobolus immersus RN42]|uniref:S-adenosyl-L-methionine-dependent methyltransferase n=1 Tax=Ascobolus immersus RN42 TaxID=1160509 RepID=A0A3N4IJF7_ASCIM|nr:S-adenosyl-L-methionine-dependent methyltransferase [Ascobolus immersus RN42]
MSTDSNPITTEAEEKKEEVYEAEHVHKVYDIIAPHFSATRYKPWPIVERFLREMPAGSVGLDVGCGNGKYLGVNPSLFMIGTDRSRGLASIANHEFKHEAHVADALDLPHPPGRFDFAISIAVIHHFSSPERRVQAVRSILATLRTDKENPGRALIYVWALEQKNSRRGWDENSPQDVFVPWVLQKGNKSKQPKEKSQKQAKNLVETEVKATASPSGDSAQTRAACEPEEEKKEAEPNPVYNRYYHLYKQGELGADAVEAGGKVIEAGYEKDNHWAIIIPA